MVKTLADTCDKILVLEEGFPVIEEALRGIFDKPYQILGRMDGKLPWAGELNPTIVGKALGLPFNETKKVPEIVASRPPSLCKGCIMQMFF